MRFFGIFISVLLSVSVVWAQVDPSSEMLLGTSGSDESTAATGLESGRYKVGGSAKNVDEKSVAVRKVTRKPARKMPASESETPATAGSVSTKASTANSTSVGQLLFAEQAPPPKKEETPEPVEVKPVVDEPSIGDQVRDLVSGEHRELIETYKEQVHPDDIRINRLEVDILPGVISNTSKSSYSFRNYNTFSPKILLGAHFWMTPFLGLYGQYTTSMGGDVMDDPSTNSRSLAQHEWTEVGFDVRKFFGMSRRSNSLQYGIHFSEYKFTVPGDDLHRVQLRSTGIGIHLLSRIPVAPSYSWTFGGKLIPRVQHSEKSTGIELSSGSTGESSRVELLLGGEFKMARQNQIIWDITTSFEKNQFNGQANQVDPETGATPRGVSVENTFVLFSLGYRWGQ